jgi:hypothetical protein
MPKCINCKTVLPSQFFGKTKPEDPRCEFCVRDTNTLRYIEDLQEKTYTKGQCEADYKEFLLKLHDNPNIRNIVESAKTKEKEFEENFQGISDEAGEIVDFKH